MRESRKVGRILAVASLLLALLYLTTSLRGQGTHSITLSWTAPTGGGVPATYNVKRSTSSGTESKIATVNVPATTYIDTNGTAGTTYFYVVSASNAFGESPNSSEVSTVFLGDKPGAPAGVSVTAQ